MVSENSIQWWLRATRKDYAYACTTKPSIEGCSALTNAAAHGPRQVPNALAIRLPSWRSKADHTIYGVPR
jgi:hypothetical protein